MSALVFCLAAATLLYTYFGYPLLLAVLARLRPRPVRKADHTPSVTLVIAAYNEAAAIGRKLENSLALDYPARRLEIIVGDDGSSDGTAEVVRPYVGQGAILRRFRRRRGKAAVLNDCVAGARGEIIVLSDATTVFRPDALRQLVRSFADPSVGAVTGRRVLRHPGSALGETDSLYWRYEEFIKAGESCIGSTHGVVGDILAVRRELYTPLPQDVINDDFVIAMRVIGQGYRVIYEPAAVSVDDVSASLGDEGARRIRLVSGRLEVLTRPGVIPWRRPLDVSQLLSHKILRPLAPLFMVVAWLANLAWWRQSVGKEGGLARLLFAGQCAFYLAAAVGGVLDSLHVRVRLLYAIYYFCRANWATAQGLLCFLLGRQTVLWEKAEKQGGTS